MIAAVTAAFYLNVWPPDWRFVLGGAVVFLGTFVVSLGVIGVLLVAIPPTYFLDGHVRDLWIDHHPIVRGTGIVLKNLAAVGLILLGLALSLPLVPGQGLLTILIGLALLDFPGKRRLERRILRRPRLLSAVNRLRARFGRGPLLLEEGEGKEL